MAYPVRAVIRPAVLTGQHNGLLSASILTSVPGQAGGPHVLLVAPAARAWRALCAAAKRDGHVLKISHPNSAYRPYADQERIFRDRYTTAYLAGRPYKTWNGRRWYQRPGTAVAAVPGTSNHGWGLAVDTGEERDSDLAAEPIDDGTLRWLIDHEHLYGWSHEVQSEPWHIRYFAGDTIPPAVLDHERGTSEEDSLDMDDNRLKQLVREVLDEGTANGQTSWRSTSKATLASIQANANRLNAILGRIPGDVDEAEVARLVLAGLDPASIAEAVTAAGIAEAVADELAERLARR